MLTLGLLSPQIESYYYALVIEGVHAVVTARGGRLLVQKTLGPNNRRIPLAHSPVHPTTVDGFVIVLDALSDGDLRTLLASGRPVVGVSRPLPDAQAPCVIADNVGGMRAVVAHLITHGHREIAYLGGPLGNEDARQRYETYGAVMQAAGLTLDPAREVLGDWSEPSGVRALETLLARGVTFSALAGANDLMVFGAMQALQAHGLRVPEDVAVAGFDDAGLARYQTPPLTTARQPIYLLGTRAATLACDWLAGTLPPPGVQTVPTTLIVRQSCGCRPPWASNEAIEDGDA